MSSPEALGQARTGVVERLRLRRDEIDDLIITRICDLSPRAAVLTDSKYLDGLRAAVVAVVDYGLTGIERGDILPATVPSAALAQAHRSAQAGVALDTVLRRYVAGYAVLEDYVIQEASDDNFPVQRTVVRHMLKTSASLLEYLFSSVASVYMREPATVGCQCNVSAHQRPTHGLSLANDLRRCGPHEHVVQLQRARIMDALVEVLAERGFSNTTIGLVVKRGRFSTRTFYQCFSGLEECLTAILDSLLERVLAFASQELQDADCWQNGVRSILAGVLIYFDSAPDLARVTVVETLAAGPLVLAHRERVMEAFRLTILKRIEEEVPRVSPLAAEGVTSLVLGIMHTHIVTGKPGPFIDLLGPLLGLTMAPYLGTQSLQREIEYGNRFAHTILTKFGRQSSQIPTAPALPHLASHARKCVFFLAEHPDSSNRDVGVALNLIHQPQTSRLLTSLRRDGLVSKQSEGKGKRNAWRLTARGEEVEQSLLRQVTSVAQSESRFNHQNLRPISL